MACARWVLTGCGVGEEWVVVSLTGRDEGCGGTTGCGDDGREGSSLFSGAGAGLRGNAGTCTASTQRAMPEREKKIDTQKAIHADV